MCHISLKRVDENDTLVENAKHRRMQDPLSECCTTFDVGVLQSAGVDAPPNGAGLPAEACVGL